MKKSRLREYLEEVLPDEKPRGAAGMYYDMLSLQLNYCIHKAVYDLSGRRVSNALSPNTKLAKGLYIVNGKKVLVK